MDYVSKDESNSYNLNKIFNIFLKIIFYIAVVIFSLLSFLDIFICIYYASYGLNIFNGNLILLLIVGVIIIFLLMMCYFFLNDSANYDEYITYTDVVILNTIMIICFLLLYSLLFFYSSIIVFVLFPN